MIAGFEAAVFAGMAVGEPGRELRARELSARALREQTARALRG